MLSLGCIALAEDEVANTNSDTENIENAEDAAKGIVIRKYSAFPPAAVIPHGLEHNLHGSLAGGHGIGHGGYSIGHKLGHGNELFGGLYGIGSSHKPLHKLIDHKPSFGYGLGHGLWNGLGHGLWQGLGHGHGLGHGLWQGLGHGHGHGHEFLSGLSGISSHHKPRPTISISGLNSLGHHIGGYGSNHHDKGQFISLGYTSNPPFNSHSHGGYSSHAPANTQGLKPFKYVKHPPLISQHFQPYKPGKHPLNSLQHISTFSKVLVKNKTPVKKEKH